ncbi:hypothetical protein D3C77_777950 [compost metagenome]
MNRHVLADELASQGRQCRPKVQGTLHVIAGEGKFFHADKVQPGVGRRVPLEQLPGAEEVQPGAESGFADGEASACR